MHLDMRDIVGVELAVAHRQSEAGGTLIDVKMLRLFGDHRHDLDPRRPCTDHRDTLGLQADVMVRPFPRQIELAPEAADARNIDLLGTESGPAAIRQ